MTTHAENAETLRSRFILLFWLPLAAGWLMMALEGPFIAAVVARMPDAALNLAAYGVAFSLAWLVESPIMMLLSASNALVRDRLSFLALRRFAFLLNAGVTLGMIVLAVPPLFRFVGEGLIDLPPEVSRLAHVATAILVPWPAAIGVRRFYQGILTRHRLTRAIAWGTVVRLAAMAASAIAVASWSSLPGAHVAAAALVSGVVAEAVAIRWMARRVIRSLVESDAVVPGTLVRTREIARFYWPLAMTSVLSMALGPIVTFGLGHGRAPIESLAVWPVVIALLFIFRSGGLAFQETAVALTGSGAENDARVARVGLAIGATMSLGVVLVAFTPLESLWLDRVSGLTPALAAASIWPIRIMILLPALEYLLGIQRAKLIVERRTGPITTATAIETAGLAASLVLCIGPLGMTGAVAGAIATMIGRAAANTHLALRAPGRA